MSVSGNYDFYADLECLQNYVTLHEEQCERLRETIQSVCAEIVYLTYGGGFSGKGADALMVRTDTWAKLALYRVEAMGTVCNVLEKMLIDYQYQKSAERNLLISITRK